MKFKLNEQLALSGKGRHRSKGPGPTCGLASNDDGRGWGRSLRLFMIAAAFFGCGDPATFHDPGESSSDAHESSLVETHKSPLFGQLSFDDDACDSRQEEHIRHIWRVGKMAAQTEEYRQCVETELATNYMYCFGDRYATASDVMRVSLSPNDVDVQCRNLDEGVNGCTHDLLAGVFNGSDHNFQQDFTLSKHVINEGIALEDAGANGTWNLAGTMWHEVMHNHGYHHHPYCLGQSGYNIHENTAPHIVGTCMRETAKRLVNRAFVRVRGVAPTWEKERRIYERIKAGELETPVAMRRAIRRASESERRIVGDFHRHTSGDEIAMWNPGWGSVPLYRFMGQFFGFTTVNIPQPHRWIHDPEVQRMVGDFNGDGLDDIALRRQGWGSTPVYFANTLGGFDVTNVPQAENRINNMAYNQLVADFDGDHDADILVFNPGLSHVLVYRSNGNGSFTPIRTPLNASTHFINLGDAVRILGDFDGRNGADVVVWRPGWNSIPVYFANGDGTFRVTNIDHRDAWAFNDSDITKLVGDFDGDGRSDIALANRLGISGSRGTPVFFSNGDGSFTKREDCWQGGRGCSNLDTIQNVGAGHRLHVADFDGDGRDDILSIRVGGDGTRVSAENFVVYYSDYRVEHGGRTGSFRSTIPALLWWETYTADWISRPDVNLLIGQFSGGRGTDIALWRHGWGTVPVYAFLSRGEFTVRNNAVPYNWVNQ